MTSFSLPWYAIVGAQTALGKSRSRESPRVCTSTTDGRPMLGRKLKGKSQRELRALGLTVEEEIDDVARSEL